MPNEPVELALAVEPLKADVTSGSKVHLTVTIPDGVDARTTKWTKNGADFTLPADALVEPTPGKRDEYAVTWTVNAEPETRQGIVRWQADAPTGVSASATRGTLTVEFAPVANERWITYYQLDLEPKPALAQLPRHALESTKSGSKRRFEIEGLPPDFYAATVTAVTEYPDAPLASAAAKAPKSVEVLGAGSHYPTEARVGTGLGFIAAFGGAIALLVLGPKHATGDARVVLDNWAIAIGVLGAIALLLLLATITKLSGLLSGADGRISTSRVNVAIWTVAVAFAIMTLTAVSVGARVHGSSTPCKKVTPTDVKDKTKNGICIDGHRKLESALGIDKSFEDGLAPEYLVLLGAPFAALAGAAFVVNRQVKDGDKQKTEAANPSRLRGALTDDNGNADLVDSQYLVFTGVLLFYFIVEFVPSPYKLPPLPWGLVGLTGISAGTYFMNKVVTTNGLSVDNLVPTTAAAEAEISITGRNFLPEGSKGLPNGGIAVKIGALPATVTSASDTEVKVTVPKDATSGEVLLQTAANVVGSAGTLTVS